MTLPRVSVIVPVLDAAGDVPRLLASLAALDWPGDRLERIVVDNGSTDGTLEILERDGATVLRETAVRSSYAARNRGARGASGEWLAFTDGDCAPRPDWLRRLFDGGVAGDVGAVVGEVRALESATAVQRFIEARGLMSHGVTLPHKALPCFSTANVAIRRDLFLALGGFREDIRFFGDMDLSWRLQREGEARLLFRPEAVVLHRHRRTVGALWRQAVQHGRGVAFMKHAHPGIYRIDPREQVQRIAGMGAAVARVASRDPDACRMPFHLGVWYSGMLWGLLRGPAWTRRPSPRR